MAAASSVVCFTKKVLKQLRIRIIESTTLHLKFQAWLRHLNFNWLLRSPIGYHAHNVIGGVRIVRYQMNTEVMWSIHAFVHHEDGRFNHSAVTGFKDHRTDGQFRRSAPLPDFDIGLLLET